MLSSILVVAAIAAVIFGFKRWQSLPKSERASFARKAFMYGGAGAILILVAVGKAHWLMGFLAALLALAGRVAQFAQYAPIIKKVMGEQGEEPAQANSNQQTMSTNNSGMSKQQAADILGLDINANQDDIRTAHKRLIQKMHPDRGGSDALAKQINLAKDVLLA